MTIETLLKMKLGDTEKLDNTGCTTMTRVPNGWVCILYRRENAFDMDGRNEFRYIIVSSTFVPERL